QVAKNDPVEQTRSLIISKSLEYARAADIYELALSVNRDLISQMPITADIWKFSGTAARALYTMSRPKPAEAWISHLSDQALRDPEAETDLLQLWALSRMASNQLNPAIDEEKGRQAWIDLVRVSVPNENEGEVNRRIGLTYHLLEALGRPPVSERAWLDLASGDSSVMSVSPNAALIHLLRDAAVNGKRAETVSLVLSIYAQTKVDRMAPSLAATIVSALGAVGLEAEARALALEIALANGL
ncbi:MAG: hypothetical protein R3261_12895, partial [Alphaproteobacteria bacterium]|nr:hypothetical protein [Alphaproteobacteria bacterium]